MRLAVLGVAIAVCSVAPVAVDAIIYEAQPLSTECFRSHIREGHEVHFTYEAN